MVMKRLLIVVDYQNDFVDGTLGFPGASSYYHRILDLLNEFTQEGSDIVFTRDHHDASYLHSEEGRNLPVLHCLEGTDGIKFYGELETLAKEHRVFDKATFPSEELGEWLAKRSEAYQSIVLCGLDLSICVLANAVMAKAACPNAHIVVDLSASGSGDPHAAEVAIQALARLQVECRDLSREAHGYL